MSTLLAKYEEVDRQSLISVLTGVRDRLALAVLKTSAGAEPDYDNLTRATAQLLKTLELHAKLGGLLNDGTRIEIDARQQSVALIGQLAEIPDGNLDRMRELLRATIAGELPAGGDAIEGHAVELAQATDRPRELLARS